MKLNKWHIDLMRDAFGVELTPDDHGQMAEASSYSNTMRQADTANVRSTFQFTP